MRKVLSVFIAVCLVLSINGSLAFAATAPASAKVAASVTYRDVPATHWAHKVITTLSDRGVLSGYKDGTFRPDEMVTRVEFAKMIAIFMGLTITTTTVSSFPDVANDHWGMKYIETDKSNDLISGYPDGTYKPDNNIKRSEVSRIIVAANDKLNAKAAKSTSTAKKLEPFSDTKGHWAESYINRLREVGVADAYPDGLFRPERLCSRAEAAKLLYLLLQNVLGTRVTPPASGGSSSSSGGNNNPTPPPTQQPCPCDVKKPENVFYTWEVGPDGTVDYDGDFKYQVKKYVDDGSVFDGKVGINVPEGAVDSTTTISIAFNPDPAKPDTTGTVVSGIYDEGVGYGSFVLYKDKCYNFRFPITVTIPYITSGENNDDPSVFYRQGSYGKYIAAGVKDFGYSYEKSIQTYIPYYYERSVSFTTVHDGEFAAIAINGLGDRISGASNDGFESYDVGFQETESGDGFDIVNGDDYSNAGGNSIGMVNYAYWNYSLNKAADKPKLYGAYSDGADNPVETELIERSFLASSNAWNGGFMFNGNGEYGLSDYDTLHQLIQTMLVTGMPQLLIKGSTVQATMAIISNRNPRALLVTGFDYTEGYFRFETYDPDYSASMNPRQIGYDTGSIYPWGKGIYYFEGLSTSIEPSQLETLYYGAQNKWPTNPVSDFSKIELTSPATDEPTDTYVINVIGKVTGGLNKASYIVYNVDGLDNNDGTAVELTGANKDEFDFTIEVSGGHHTIMLYSACLEGATITRCAKPYSAFKKITISNEEIVN